MMPTRADARSRSMRAKAFFINCFLERQGINGIRHAYRKSVEQRSCMPVLLFARLLPTAFKRHSQFEKYGGNQKAMASDMPV